MPRRRRGVRPTATSTDAIRYVHSTSIRDIKSVATTFRFGSILVHLLKRTVSAVLRPPAARLLL
jgi:hypothetical protein